MLYVLYGSFSAYYLGLWRIVVADVSALLSAEQLVGVGAIVFIYGKLLFLTSVDVVDRESMVVLKSFRLVFLVFPIITMRINAQSIDRPQPITLAANVTIGDMSSVADSYSTSSSASVEMGLTPQSPLGLGS